MNVGTLTAHFDLDARKFTVSLKQVEKGMASTTKTVESSSQSISSASKSMVKSLGAVTISIGLLAAGAYKGVLAFGKMASSITAMDRKLKFALGGAKEADRIYKNLVHTSETLGISLDVSSNAFANLAAASRGTSLAGKETENLFDAMSQASVVLGLDNRSLELSFRAFSQMMSIGKVRAEELRGQLGDHLAGALAIMSRALGVTGKELDKLLEQGDLITEEVLPLFSKQLTKELAPAVEAASKSMAASIGRLDTAWFKLKKTIVEGNVGSIVQSAIEGMAGAVNFLNDQLRETGSLIKLPDLSKFSKTLLGLKGFAADSGAGSLGLGAFSPPPVPVVEPTPEPAQAETNIAATTQLIDEETVAVTHLSEAIAALREKSDGLFAGEQLVQFQTFLDIGQGALKTFEDAIVNFVKTGKLSFEDFARSIIADMTRVALQIQVTQPLMEAWSGFLAGSIGGTGSGGIGATLFSGLSKIIGFAKGGVLKEPVVGFGVNSGQSYSFAENGPEVITPMGQGKSMSNAVGGTETQTSVAPATNVTFNISAVDSKSVVDLMRSNPDAITVPLTEALNVGDRGMINSIRGAVI